MNDSILIFPPAPYHAPLDFKVYAIEGGYMMDWDAFLKDMPKGDDFKVGTMYCITGIFTGI